MLTGIFADKPVYRKFLILVSLVLFSTIIFSMLAGLLVQWLYGIDMLNNPSALSNFDDPSVVSALKLMQLLTTGIGMFLVPSILAAIVFDENPSEFLGTRTKTKLPVVIYTILIMFASVPLINMLIVFNEGLQLPAFLSGVEEWIKESEAKAAKITEVFLVMNSPNELLYNLLIVAILPAIGEEFLFRGILQRFFQEMTKNIHVTIFITAALFSAIHMQFYGFLPRMMLGILFGYLLYWTGSIWIPVLAHFVNNGAAVIFAYLSGKNELPFNQDTLGTESGDMPFTIVSCILVVMLGFLISKSNSWRTKLPDDYQQ